MRYLKILIFMVVTMTMFSCHHTSEPTRIPVEYTQLKIVYLPFLDKDNGLIDWKGPNHASVINSIEDIYSTQTELFIRENPEWLYVDFSTKSIIAIQEFLTGYNYLIGVDVKSFYINNDNKEVFLKKGDYVMSIAERFKQHDYKEESNDASQWCLYQVAIVTDKIPSDSHIHVFTQMKME